MRSMTGYGRGVVEVERVRATVDVRSVNHRFLDLKLRGAALSPALEEVLSSRVRAAIERGSVTVSVNVARAAAAGAAVIDDEAAARAHAALAGLAAMLGLAPPDLALVLAQPGVVRASGEGEAEAGLEAVVAAATEQALVQHAAMRAAEGLALATELRGRLGELAALRVAIAEHAAGVPQLVARRLSERVRKLLEASGGPAVEPGRLAQEVALLADRADVTEELVRLASHLDQARALVDGAGSAGRRLDFLIQEIGRELNTIGSKSVAAEITSAVVEGKAVLEKLREQVQNVE